MKEGIDNIRLYEMVLRYKTDNEKSRDEVNKYYTSLFAALVSIAPLLDSMTSFEIFANKNNIKYVLLLISFIGFILLLSANFLHIANLESGVWFIVSAISCLVMSLTLYLINYYLRKHARYKLLNPLLSTAKLVNGLQYLAANLTTKKWRNNHKLLIYTIVGAFLVSTLKHYLKR